MGFTEAQASQAYFACEKNEVMAANYLFENVESMREEAEGASPGVHPPGASIFPPHPAPPSVVEVKKEEKKVEGQPEKKEEGINI